MMKAVAGRSRGGIIAGMPGGRIGKPGGRPSGLPWSDDVLVCIISPQSEGMRGNIQTVTLDAAGQAQASFHTHFQNRYVQSGTRGENIFPVCQFRAQFGNLCRA